MHGFRRARDMACSNCSSELRAGFFLDARARNAAAWVDMFDFCGSLYSETYDAREREDLVAEIAERIGCAPEEPPPQRAPFVAVRWNRSFLNFEGKIRERGEGGQDWYSLFPKSSTERMYPCAECSKAAPTGWVCVDCRVFVCRRCGSAEAHRHGNGLGEITYAAAIAAMEAVKASKRRAKPRVAPGFVGFDAIPEEARSA